MPSIHSATGSRKQPPKIGSLRQMVLGGETNGTIAFRCGGRRGGGEPLRLAHVRAAGHADVAVAPVLGGDPLDRVVAVVGLVEVGPEIPIGVEAAAAVVRRRRCSRAGRASRRPADRARVLSYGVRSSTTGSGPGSSGRSRSTASSTPSRIGTRRLWVILVVLVSRGEIGPRGGSPAAACSAGWSARLTCNQRSWPPLPGKSRAWPYPEHANDGRAARQRARCRKLPGNAATPVGGAWPGPELIVAV